MFCTDNLWLREIRTEYDDEESCTEYDEPLEMKQQHTTGTRPNGFWRVKGGGHGFETQLAALIGLRGSKRRDNFQLFFNRDDDGNFDDLVYTADGRQYFLLTKGELVTVLRKFINSYCDVKRGNNLRDIPVDNMEFIIYTDRKLYPELSQHTRKQTRGDVFFKTRDKEIFKFIPDKIKDTDVYTVLENAVKGNKEIQGSSDQEMVSEFLNKVILVTPQRDKCHLDEEIRKEIEEQDAIKVPRQMYMAELRYLKTRVATCLKKRKEGMTAEMFRNWLQEAKTKVCHAFVRNLFVSCTKGLLTTGINFADSEISRLQAELSNKPALHLRTDALTMCSILLTKCVPESKCIYVNMKSLQRDRNKLLHAWFGGDWQWCVVICDSDIREIHISDMCFSMFSIMKPMASNKRLIILTPFSVRQIQGFSPIDHKFKFEHLSRESQKMLIDGKLAFQFHKLRGKSILHQHAIVEHALGSLGADMFSGVVTKGTLHLGGRLRANRGYYEPNVLEREVWLTQYFTGHWFSRNFEFTSIRSLLERILFDPEYSFVRNVFDRMLAKDCPLHCAVLEWDEESFERLLERCDVSAEDKGGRTVMHIIATRHCTFLDIINRVFPDEASVHNKDCILQWTPLQYAVKSENWVIVERLLERNVDRSGLNMIWQRAHDPDYIDPIIMHAATYGHLLLLEFLCSIGVNIHRANSRGFLSPLHAAIQEEQLPVVRCLIQHGADCNSRYSDGRTPLFHAVTEGSLDVVRALVEEGGASVDLRDDEDRTVFDWMNDYASDPKNLDDILWKGDVERLSEIVMYLQERGVESSAIYL